MNLETVLPYFPKNNVCEYKKGVILLGQVGSHAYGTTTNESDQDVKGVFIPSPATYFSMVHTTEFNGPSQTQNFKNNKNDVDLVLVPFVKFVQDAAKAYPNNLELLFLEPENYLHQSPEGKELIAFRENLLSKQVGHRFYGYARSQTYKMRAKRQESEANLTTIHQYGYDTKFYMHAVRLITSATTILKTGTFQVKHPEAEELLELRHGKHTFDQACEHIDDLNYDLQEAHKNASLPEEPNWSKINQKLTELTIAFMKRCYFNN